MELEVVGLGAMNMDHLYRVEAILSDGEGVVEAEEEHPGGSAANTIYGLARLGVGCGFAGAVGDDEAGKRLVSDLAGVGVDTQPIVTRPGARTGAVLGIVDRQGQRALYVLPGANGLLDRQDIDLGYINSARLLHTSAFVHEAQFQLQKELAARMSTSVALSFAPGALYATRGLESIRPLVARSRILFLNSQELKSLAGDDFAVAARRLLGLGCHTVVVTLGRGIEGEGKRLASYVLSQKEEHWVEAVVGPGQVKDTTGAGDAFAAGFIFGHLRGKGVVECTRLGEIMASFAISQMGARPGLPSREKLAARYRQLCSNAL